MPRTVRLAPVLLAGLAALLPACAQKPAGGAGTKAEVKALAEKIATATKAGDFATVIDLTHPKLVDKLGGREKAIATTTAMMKEMAENGLVIESVVVGEPEEPVRAGADLYLLVPTTMSASMRGKKINGNSALLGVSTDDGKTWKFIDCSPGSAEIRGDFPNIPKSITIPESTHRID